MTHGLYVNKHDLKPYIEKKKENINSTRKVLSAQDLFGTAEFPSLNTSANICLNLYKYCIPHSQIFPKSRCNLCQMGWIKRLQSTMKRPKEPWIARRDENKDHPTSTKLIPLSQCNTEDKMISLIFLDTLQYPQTPFQFLERPYN